MKRSILYPACIILAAVISSCTKTVVEGSAQRTLTEEALVETLSGTWSDMNYLDGSMRFAMKLSEDGTCSVDLVSCGESGDAGTKSFLGTWHPVVKDEDGKVSAGFEWTVTAGNRHVSDIVMLRTSAATIAEGMEQEDYYLDFNRDVICGLFDMDICTADTKSSSPYVKSTKWYKVKDMGSLSLGSWMSGIPDSRKVCNMSIPGTHDTFTYDCSLLLDVFAMTQLLNIEGQWLAGVRCFDIRVNATIASSLKLSHGPVNFMSLSSGLESINSMLVRHPSETAIMVIRIEMGKESDKVKANINNAITSAFGKRIADWRPDITLGEARGKVIILYRYDIPSGLQPLGPSLHGFGNNNHGQSMSMRKAGGEVSAPLWVQDEYEGSSAKSFWTTKKRMMTENFQYMASLTDSGNPQNIWAINHTSGYVPVLNYSKNSGEMNPWAADYIRANPHKLTGIVSMDFAGVNVHFDMNDTKCHELPSVVIGNNR